MDERLERLDRDAVTLALAHAGCVAAGRGGRGTPGRRRRHRRSPTHGGAVALPASRWPGSPGRTVFCGIDVAVDPGVYVPRWQSEPLARLVVELLPPDRGGGGPVHGIRGHGHGHAGGPARTPGWWPPRSTRWPSGVPGGTVWSSTGAPGPGPPARSGGRGRRDDRRPPVRTRRRPAPPAPRRAALRAPRRPGRRSGRPRVGHRGGGRSPSWVRPGGWLALEVGGDQVPAVAALFEAAGYGALERARGRRWRSEGGLRTVHGPPVGALPRCGPGAGVTGRTGTSRRSSAAEPASPRRSGCRRGSRGQWRRGPRRTASRRRRR